MIDIITGIVTAVATTAAAVFMWKEWKMRTTPYITSVATHTGDDGCAILLTIHPAANEIRLAAVQAKGAKIAHLKRDNYNPETGEVTFMPDHEPTSERLVVDISLPPSSVSNKPESLSLWLSRQSSARSSRIALIASHKYFTVKYWLTV